MNTTHMVKTVLVLSMMFGANAARAQDAGDGQFANFPEALQAAIDDVGAQNYDDARADLKQAIALSKTIDQVASSQLLLARVDIFEKKYTQARKGFADVLALDGLSGTSQVSALAGIGEAFEGEGKSVEARDFYNRASKVKNISMIDFLSVQEKKAHSFLVDKKYPEARAEFNAVLNYPDALPYVKLMAIAGVANTFLEEGAYEAARTKYAEILAWKDQAKPGPADPVGDAYDGIILQSKQLAQLLTADSYFREKNFGKAKEQFTAVLALANLNPMFKSKAEIQLQAIAEQEKAP